MRLSSSSESGNQLGCELKRRHEAAPFSPVRKPPPQAPAAKSPGHPDVLPDGSRRWPERVSGREALDQDQSTISNLAPLTRWLPRRSYCVDSVFLRAPLPVCLLPVQSGERTRTRCKVPDHWPESAFRSLPAGSRPPSLQSRRFVEFQDPDNRVWQSITSLVPLAALRGEAWWSNQPRGFKSSPLPRLFCPCVHDKGVSVCV